MMGGIHLDRRSWAPAATALIFVVLFCTAGLLYPGFFSVRVVRNLVTDNAILGVTAVGMTFVILSGGIDLSVGAVMAFTSIFVAAAVMDWHLHPAAAWAAALLLGGGFGAGLGALIHVYRLPPFLVTLAGMFFARGMAFVVKMESLGIRHPLYERLSAMGLPLVRGTRLPPVALVFLVVLLAGAAAAHWTAFGRNVYAVGGSEESAVLMGLPVGRTKVLVYAVSGFCAALAGVLSTLYMGSGDPARGFGLELDAIAAVVIGGAALTGGSGCIEGTLFGVLIYGTIQMALVFDGRLNAWWLRIGIGMLLLAFVVLQRLLGGSVQAGNR